MISTWSFLNHCWVQIDQFFFLSKRVILKFLPNYRVHGMSNVKEFQHLTFRQEYNF